MTAMMASAAISGRSITRTGHYRRRAVIGVCSGLGGLLLLWQISVDTSLLGLVAMAAMLGTAVGATFQVVVLGAQLFLALCMPRTPLRTGAQPLERQIRTTQRRSADALAT